MSAKIVIKPNREKPIRNQHPWIFSGAIDEVKGNPNPGDIVTVVDKSEKFLACGYWNPKSQIQVRILTWKDEEIDDEGWRRMLKRAIAARGNYLYSIRSIACRLINAENDFIPGLIVDKYADWLVLQALTLGIDQRKQLLAKFLMELLEPQGIYERSDVDVRSKEGLRQETGLLSGAESPELVEVDEGRKILVDIRHGHKTGYYLDQRNNRGELYHLLQVSGIKQPRILNLFSYTGGFGLFTGKTGYVINVDSSRDALELAEKNFQLNDFDIVDTEFIQADGFDYLHDIVEQGEQFDIVVCDPPKFAHNAQQVERAARGYKDLNLNCFKIIKSGGYLMTFSCSGAVSADLFQKIVFGALADSRRQAQILRHLGPGDDHPVALTFPEGAYLKGLLLRVY
jgi:23S rRNA (cytosine1962-C5)-methyltransferase